MTYRKIGFAAAIIGALRSAIADPELVGKVEAVNTRMDEMKTSFAAITASDAEQQAQLDGLIGELEELTVGLTGPADDDTDNGVIGEVEVAPGSEEPSPAADAIVEEAEADDVGEDAEGEEATEEAAEEPAEEAAEEAVEEESDEVADAGDENAEG